MPSFADRLRQLRQLFDPGSDAPAATAPGQRPGGASSLRAEARRKRKLDMRERLGAMMRPDGTLQGGLVKFINLEPIRVAVGDRWAAAFPKVELMSESIIRGEVGEDDLFLTHNDQGFVVIFTDAKLTDGAAEERCRAIFEAIRILLLGQDDRVDVPDFSVDPVAMLAALDNDAPLPLKIAIPAPPRMAKPPAAAGQEPSDPGAARPAAFDDGWRPMFGERGQGDDPDWQTGPDGRRAVDRGLAAGAEGAVRSEREVAVSGERPGAEGRFGPSGDRTAPGSGAWGPSADRPAARAGTWGPSADRAGLEGGGQFGPSGERVAPGGADWGESSDRPASAAEFGRSGERSAATPRLVPIEIGARGPAPRLQVMGKAADLFVGLTLGYRGFWDAKHEAVTTYVAEPYVIEGGVTRGPAWLIERGRANNALGLLDLAVVERAVADIGPLIQNGQRLFLALPISFATLARRSDKMAFLEHWSAVPEPMRRLSRFLCWESSLEIGDLPLSEALMLLRQLAREPVFAAPTIGRELDRLAQQRVQAVELDCLGISTGPSAPAAVRRIVGHAKQARLAAYVGGLGTPELRQIAIEAGAAFLDMKVSKLADLPVKPRRLTAAEAAAGA